MGLIWITLQIHLPASPRCHGHKPFPEVHFDAFSPLPPSSTRSCRWLEAKELSGNWIQSQDNNEKNKMQVSAAPCPLLSQKNEFAFGSGCWWKASLMATVCGTFPRGERVLANKMCRMLWKASETWGYICVFNKRGPHAFIRSLNCQWTLKYQINKLEKWHFRWNCIYLVDASWTYQINHIRIKYNLKMYYTLH